jgi:hypothetical protein
MVGCLIRGLGGVAALALVAYGAVAVPIGRRPLAGHLAEIAATRPARELREDLAAAVVEALRPVARWLRDPDRR